VTPYIAAYGPAQTTETRIAAISPTPSSVGQPVELSVRVTALTAPRVGHITITGSPGGSCTDPTLSSINATTATAQCTIQWNTGCPRLLVANYVGGSDGVTTWQSSKSPPSQHMVLDGTACAPLKLFADGFE